MQLRQKLHAVDDPREGRELLPEREGTVEEAGDLVRVRVRVRVRAGVRVRVRVRAKG